MPEVRTGVKRVLARALPPRTGTRGSTILTYHRVAAGCRDELAVTPDDFVDQMRTLTDHNVLDVDSALDALEAGDTSPSVVLTFDDGFEDVYSAAWPVLRALGLPFTLYVASAFVGGLMRWPGSTARDGVAPALTWRQIGEMVDSGLCTLGNHTHHHVRPELLCEQEIDLCSDTVRARLGVLPRHFAYPWGTPVQAMTPALRTRFRSAVIGGVGRNLPGTDLMQLRRVPVRRSDPPEFFQAKLVGELRAERAYSRIVTTTKRAVSYV